jgi:hypothetical protein
MSTAPKPFVFVLMPFDPKFSDIYKFGIKGAADEVGAYAERIDEQIFTEGILDRIFNQIAKADVVVADMTGRNPNVFYEVGYAHALGKLVLLLTQDSNDIPFDLKHKQHTVYGGKIELLRTELAQKLSWALVESKRQQKNPFPEQFSLRCNGIDIPSFSLSSNYTSGSLPAITGGIKSRDFEIPIEIRNDSAEAHIAITHAYLFLRSNAKISPVKRKLSRLVGGTTYIATTLFDDSDTTTSPFNARPLDAPDGLTQQYRLPITFSSMPPDAIEQDELSLTLLKPDNDCDEICRLRLHSSIHYFDFPFKLSVNLLSVSSNEEKK